MMILAEVEERVLHHVLIAAGEEEESSSSTGALGEEQGETGLTLWRGRRDTGARELDMMIDHLTGAGRSCPEVRIFEFCYCV